MFWCLKVGGFIASSLSLMGSDEYIEKNSMEM